MDDLVQRVRVKRLSRGLSIRSLASVCGVSFATLARLEREEGTKPDEGTRHRLVRWLTMDEASSPRTRVDGEDPWFERIERRLSAIEAAVRKLGGDMGHGSTNEDSRPVDCEVLLSAPSGSVP